MDIPSRSQVKKAGGLLRRYMRGDITDSAVWHQALQTMESWRRAHALPLVTANNGLRSRARTIEVAAEVTQRLKRSQTILDKLKREPTLDLSRMQDIGGCRAVVETKSELRRLEQRIVSSLTPLTHTDYVANPRESGYRGVHVVVAYHGRSIEIQLRTQSMHAWALATERYSQLTGENLKRDGMHPVQEFLKVAADIIDLQSDGLGVTPRQFALLQKRRMDALPYLEGDGR